MRIIGGKYGRRIISPPKNLPVRPTTDLAKESLFNIIIHKTDLAGIDALDLFAGTGSISFELVSRGCKSVVAVDKNYKCIEFIKKASAEYGMEELNARQSDVFQFIKTNAATYDLIFADPPYQLERLAEINEAVFKHKLLKPQGWLIIEQPIEISFAEAKYFVEHRKYGKVNFSFFRASDNNDQTDSE